jgi:hypothetical protein
MLLARKHRSNSLSRAARRGLKQSGNSLTVPAVFRKSGLSKNSQACAMAPRRFRNRLPPRRFNPRTVRNEEGHMEDASGILWALQIVVGPIILGLALAYGMFQWRRRRRLQGEGNYTTREIVMMGLPAIAAVALLTILMMIPGSQ